MEDVAEARMLAADDRASAIRANEVAAANKMAQSKVTEVKAATAAEAEELRMMTEAKAMAATARAEAIKDIRISKAATPNANRMR